MDKFYSEELKTVSTTFATFNQNFSLLDDLLVLTNNFHKLIRILAFIFRFIENCKVPGRFNGRLSLKEYRRAETFLIKGVEVSYFAAEISALKKGDPVPRSSKLKFLNPFLDGLRRIKSLGLEADSRKLICRMIINFQLFCLRGVSLQSLFFSITIKEIFMWGRKAY